MKGFLMIFKNSVQLPRRQAVFSLNRVGMDRIIVYLFLILALASIPGLVDRVQANAEATFYVQTFFLLIFFFMFYYLVLVLIVLGSLSAVAYIGGWIARAAGRKLRYQVLWKTAACITTIPVFLFTLLSFFYSLHTPFLISVMIFHFVIFLRSILLYPKRRK